MQPVKVFMLAVFAVVFAGCQAAPTNTTNTAGNSVSVANAANTSGAASNSAVQNLTEEARPQKIADQMNGRSEQDAAAPTLKVIEPRDGANVSTSTVKIKLEISGDLKGYKPMKDMATGMGNHIHVILDNQPYEAYYDLGQEFELRNVADGEHTLRFFPSRPWHESYKNPEAFQMVRFTVKGGGADASKPATTNANQAMSNANASATPEGKDMANSTAGAVDSKKPLLTYSRPKGEYKGADVEAIMIDFWLSNARLPNEDYLETEGRNIPLCRVRYSVDGGETKFIDTRNLIWLSGWTNGKHTTKLELVDKDGNLIDNGGYNSTTREITVVK